MAAIQYFQQSQQMVVARGVMPTMALAQTVVLAVVAQERLALAEPLRRIKASVEELLVAELVVAVVVRVNRVKQLARLLQMAQGEAMV
jgi:Tfp pilus assembly pilus retraction ATPase PilT